VAVQLLERLERYLEKATVVQAFTHSMGGGGHPNSFVAILEGGVSVLVKSVKPSDEQKKMDRREAAPDVFARATSVIVSRTGSSFG
jgi:hypothetical protein